MSAAGRYPVGMVLALFAGCVVVFGLVVWSFTLSARPVLATALASSTVAWLYVRQRMAPSLEPILWRVFATAILMTAVWWSTLHIGAVLAPGLR